MTLERWRPAGSEEMYPVLTPAAAWTTNLGFHIDEFISTCYKPLLVQVSYLHN
jgi:hypothetical protein